MTVDQFGFLGGGGPGENCGRGRPGAFPGMSASSSENLRPGSPPHIRGLKSSSPWSTGIPTALAYE